MSILFDFYETPSPSGEEAEKRYHPRMVLSQVVNTKMVVDIIHERSSLSRGDVLSTLQSLRQLLSEELRKGNRVHIDGIGYFSVVLGSFIEISTPKDMHARNVGVKTVKFRIDKQLKSDIRNTQVKRLKNLLHSARLSVEEIDERLATYFKEHQVLTRKNFQILCEMTQVTAFRHIHRLLEEGKIKNVNTARNPIYVPGKKEEPLP